MIAKKRILLVPDSFPWILGTWAKEICRWNSSRYEFYFISSKVAIADLETFQRLASYVDLVHILSPHCLSYLVDFLDPAKTISSIHHVVEWKPDFDIAVGCSRIMVVSAEWRDYLLERGVAPSKISLIYNGIDPERLFPFSEKDRKTARKKFGIADNEFVIGTFCKRSSNQDDRKGINTLISSISELQALIPHMPVKVLLTGPGWEDIAAHGIGDSIVYRPYLPPDDMCAAYNCLDVYLVCSRIEGGPVPLIEAMACGVPVVTTEVGMARDLIRHRENGIIIPKEAPRKIASAIAELVQNQQLKQAVASAGCSLIREKYTWRRTIGCIGELYDPAFNVGIVKTITQSLVRLLQKPAFNAESQRHDAILADEKWWARELDGTTE